MTEERLTLLGFEVRLDWRMPPDVSATDVAARSTQLRPVFDEMVAQRGARRISDFYTAAEYCLDRGDYACVLSAACVKEAGGEA